MWPFAQNSASSDPLSPSARPSGGGQTVILNVEVPPTEKCLPPVDTDLRDHRLSIPFHIRLMITAAFCICTGFYQGAGKGGTTAALRYRAENAHRLPTTKNGWYFYHRTKNYHSVVGSVKGGAVLGSRLAVWGCLFTSFEEGVDRLRAGAGRKSRDAASTVCAGMGTAGIYNLVKKHDMFTSSRLGKMALKFSLAFGLTQDLLSTLRGVPPAYIEWIATRFGLSDRLPGVG